MKKLLIFIVIGLLPALLLAQNAPVDKLFDKYAGKEGYTTVYISKYMFEMFKQIDTEDEDVEELNKVLGKLQGIRILAVEDERFIDENINFYDEIMKELPREKYNELMVIKEKDSDVVFLAREEKGVIVELLLVGGGDDASDNVLISIQGEIDLENIAKISRSLGVEALENLEEMDEH